MSSSGLGSSVCGPSIQLAVLCARQRGADAYLHLFRCIPASADKFSLRANLQSQSINFGASQTESKAINFFDAFEPTRAVFSFMTSYC